MSNEIESAAPDVSIEESSPSVESSSPESSKEVASPSQEKYVPYERFQEVIKDKQEFIKRMEESDRKYQDLHKSFESLKKPAEPSKEALLIDRFKKMDPEFGAWAEQQEAMRQELAEMKAWRSQSENARVQSDANAALERLHVEHKVDKSTKEIYDALIRAEASRRPQLTVSDLPILYKQVHTTMSQFLESQKRANLASYSAAKTVDAAVPKTTRAPAAAKGSAPAKPTFSKDPEVARAEIVKRALANRSSE